MRFYRGLRMKVWRLGSGPGLGRMGRVIMRAGGGGFISSVRMGMCGMWLRIRAWRIEVVGESRLARLVLTER